MQLILHSDEHVPVQWWDYANGKEKLKKLAVSLAVDFKAAGTGDGISALPNPTGGGGGGGGSCTLLMHQQA